MTLVGLLVVLRDLAVLVGVLNAATVVLEAVAMGRVLLVVLLHLRFEGLVDALALGYGMVETFGTVD